jgi:hypothetical protein
LKFFIYLFFIFKIHVYIQIESHDLKNSYWNVFCRIVFLLFCTGGECDSACYQNKTLMSHCWGEGATQCQRCKCKGDTLSVQRPVPEMSIWHFESIKICFVRNVTNTSNSVTGVANNERTIRNCTVYCLFNKIQTLVACTMYMLLFQ